MVGNCMLKKFCGYLISILKYGCLNAGREENLFLESVTSHRELVFTYCLPCIVRKRIQSYTFPITVLTKPSTFLISGLLVILSREAAISEAKNSLRYTDI